MQRSRNAPPLFAARTLVQACATTSLPVPVSPSTMIGRSLRAARSAGSTAARSRLPPNRPEAIVLYTAGAVSPRSSSTATPTHSPSRNTSPGSSGASFNRRPFTNRPFMLSRSRTMATGPMRISSAW